jgi:predicted RNA binding protein with dsRBD fold (UPF0201 family)
MSKSTLLDIFSNPSITELYDKEDNKSTFLVRGESSHYILQTIKSPLENVEIIKKAKEIFETAKQLQQLTKNLFIPINIKEVPEESKAYLEILYKVENKLLLYLNDKEPIEGKVLMDIASNLLNYLSLLGSNKISYLKSEGVLDELLDIGYLISNTSAYYPPEFNASSGECRSEGFYVYYWGMILYQLITKKNIEEVITYRLSGKNSAEFVKDVTNALNNKEVEFIMQLVVKALDEELTNRPTFDYLRSLLAAHEVIDSSINIIGKTLSSREFTETSSRLINDFQNTNITAMELHTKLRNTLKMLNRKKKELYKLHKENERLGNLYMINIRNGVQEIEK